MKAKTTNEDSLVRQNHAVRVLGAAGRPALTKAGYDATFGWALKRLGRRPAAYEASPVPTLNGQVFTDLAT